MRERLAYLHLPKSAGTSIRAALSSFYDEAATAPWTFDHILLGRHPAAPDIDRPLLLGDGSALRDYRYAEGHWALPTLLEGFDAADVVCLLREPRARVLSHYTFWRGWAQEQHDVWGEYDAATCARLPLSGFLTDPKVAHQADNLVARLVLGDHDRVPFDAPIAADDIDELADEACARLDEIGHVDVIDRGDDVYTALEAWFGDTLSRHRMNVTDLDRGERVDLDDLLDRRTLALLHERTAIDLRIWHHVAARRGLSEREARAIADVSYGASIGKIVRAHSVHEARPSIESAARAVVVGEIEELALTQRPPAAVRLVRLIRRGPRVWRDRIVDEVEYRRSRRNGDG